MPTCTSSIHCARSPRGAQSTASLKRFLEFALMAFITIVDPSMVVSTNILPTRLKDYRKESTVVGSWVGFSSTFTQAVMKGLKKSVRMA